MILINLNRLIGRIHTRRPVSSSALINDYHGRVSSCALIIIVVRLKIKHAIEMHWYGLWVWNSRSWCWEVNDVQQSRSTIHCNWQLPVCSTWPRSRRRRRRRRGRGGRQTWDDVASSGVWDGAVVGVNRVDRPATCLARNGVQPSRSKLGARKVTSSSLTSRFW